MPSERALHRSRSRALRTLSWTPPTKNEVAVVLRAGVAAGVSYAVARIVTGVPNPLLAPTTAIVTTQATAWSSVRAAVQRSIAVAVGVIIALVIGDAVGLNALTITLLVSLSLAISVLVLRFSGGAANQLPITVLLVLAVVSTGKTSYGVGRAVDTLIGAAIGGAASIVFPASRLGDAREALSRLVKESVASLDAMSAGVHSSWSKQDTSEWGERAQWTRNRVARHAVDAVGFGQRAAKWNHRDRRRLDELNQLEEMAPRLERVSVGVSGIARDLDQTAARRVGPHPPMAKMAALLEALAHAVEAYGGQLDEHCDPRALAAALQEVRARREACQQGATRRARLAVDDDPAVAADPAADEWLDYGDVLLQTDWIVADLTPEPEHA